MLGSLIFFRGKPLRSWIMFFKRSSVPLKAIYSVRAIYTVLFPFLQNMLPNLLKGESASMLGFLMLFRGKPLWILNNVI